MLRSWQVGPGPSPCPMDGGGFRDLFFFFLFFAFVNAHSSGRHTVFATSLPSRRTGPVLHGSIPASHHCSDVLGKLYFQRLALCRHHA